MDEAKEKEIYYELAVEQFKGITMEDSAKAYVTIAERFNISLKELRDIAYKGSVTNKWEIPDYPAGDHPWNTTK